MEERFLFGVEIDVCPACEGVFLDPGEAEARGILLFGDLPIYVSRDSADVWANPSLFDLNFEGIPNKVAGVPPDYFSENGQLWGNPLFDWKEHKKQKFKWWTQRIMHNLKLYDCVRIDHFRGFESCWAVPAEESTAINGQWEKAPGSELFNAIKSQVKDISIIAEDLGVITPEVEALLKIQISILVFSFVSKIEIKAWVQNSGLLIVGMHTESI